MISVGDRRKAIVLSIAAVAAVVFLVFQLFPSSSAPSGQQATQAEASPKKRLEGSLPVRLATSPFSHPSLGTERPPLETGQAARPAAESPPANPLQGIDLMPPATWRSFGVSPSPDDPEKTSGSARQSEQAPKRLRARLLGVVGAGTEFVALVSIDGEAAMKLLSGSRIGANARVRLIDAEGVDIEIGGRGSRLRVGDEVDL